MMSANTDATTVTNERIEVMMQSMPQALQRTLMQDRAEANKLLPILLYWNYLTLRFPLRVCMGFDLIGKQH